MRTVSGVNDFFRSILKKRFLSRRKPKKCPVNSWTLPLKYNAIFGCSLVKNFVKKREVSKSQCILLWDSNSGPFENLQPNHQIKAALHFHLKNSKTHQIPTKN
jgi:hypothetical protein